MTAVLRIVAACFCAAAVVFALLSPSSAATSPAGDPLLDPSTGPDDLQEALAELAAAGVAPSEQELRALLGLERIPSGGEAEHRPAPLHSGLTWRLEPTQTGADPRVGLVQVAGPLSLRVSCRSRPREPRSVRGAVRIDSDLLEVRAGDVGYGWGQGALAARPGRGTSLSADDRLRPPRTGPSSGGSAFERWAATGVAARLRLGAWRFGGLAGAVQDERNGGKDRRALVELGFETDAVAAGLVLSRNGTESGAGLAGNWRRGMLDGSGEAAGWQQDGGGDGRAFAAALGAQPMRSLRVEAAVAAATGRGAARAGRRSPLLPANEGSGWAVRCGYRAPGGVGARVLVSRGRGIEADATPSCVTRDLTDVDLTWRARPRTRCAVRWRNRRESVGAWSVLYPWEPVSWRPATVRNVLTLSVEQRTRRLDGRAMLRVLTDDDGERNRDRSLFGLQGGWHPGQRWRIRFAWTAAWGGDADLLSATVPIQGVMLPRHWGHWSSESLLGIETDRRRWGVRAAFSRRLPTLEAAGKTEWTVWAGGSLRW